MSEITSISEESEKHAFEAGFSDTHWNKYLLEFVISKLPQEIISESKYNEASFGTWWVVVGNFRLLLDGKDQWLFLQQRNSDKWTDLFFSKRHEIHYEGVMELINQLLLQNFAEAEKQYIIPETLKAKKDSFWDIAYSIILMEIFKEWIKKGIGIKGEFNWQAILAWLISMFIGLFIGFKIESFLRN